MRQRIPVSFTARFARFGSGLAALLLVLATLAPISAFGAQSAAKPYDIMVMVVANATGPAEVAVSYPSQVSHDAVRAAIADLGKRAGATPAKVVVRDAPLAQGATARATDAQFTGTGLIGANGVLPVGPIIRALPNWQHMRLVFVVDPSYPFVGPGDATADGFAVRLVNRVATYEYDVERISGAPRGGGAVSAAASAGQGGRQSARASGSTAGPAGSSFSRQVLPAALIGAPSGVLVGWLLYGWRERRERARRLAASRAGSARPAPVLSRPERTSKGT